MLVHTVSDFLYRMIALDNQFIQQLLSKCDGMSNGMCRFTPAMHFAACRSSNNAPLQNPTHQCFVLCPAVWIIDEATFSGKPES